MSSRPPLIPDAGASLATTNVLGGKAPIRWLERESSQDPVDNGWRVMSDIDDSDYLSNEENWRIVDFNELCEIEPAMIAIWHLPVGSELTLATDAKGHIRFFDDKTGQPISDAVLYGADADLD